MNALRTVRKFFPKVEMVVDATRNALIEVTAKDASSKAVKNHSACAMAVACKRKFHLDGVIVSRSVAYLIKGKKARRFELPPSVQREITSFDRGAGFAVGKYELSHVSESQQLGPRKYSPTPHRDHSNQNKRFRHITTNVRSVLGGAKA